MLRIAQCTDTFLPVSDGVGRVAYAYSRALALRAQETLAPPRRIVESF